MSKTATFASWLGILALLGTAPALQAAEEITLKNGFNLLCDHREQAGDRVRLFTSQGSGNFVEVDAAEIDSVDVVPDPPPAAVSNACRRTQAHQCRCAPIDCPGRRQP